MDEIKSKAFFKSIISEHAFTPIKMAIILYVLEWIYYTFNNMKFDYVDTVLKVLGYFIVYVFIRVIAIFISFNERNSSLDPYGVNDSVDNKIKSFLGKFKVYDDRKGVYKEIIKMNDDSSYIFTDIAVENPLELYYTIWAYMSIVKKIGSYSSMELYGRLRELLEKTEEMLTEEDIQNQYYANVD